MANKIQKNYTKGVGNKIKMLQKLHAPNFRKHREYQKRTEFETDELKKQFLELYKQEGMSGGKIAEKLNFRRTTIYKWMQTDAEFALAYEKIRFEKDHTRANAWEKKHGRDTENKKIFLEQYADPAASVTSVVKTMGKNVNEHSVGYWKKTDGAFKEKFEELQCITRPRHAASIKRRSALAKKNTKERQDRFLEVFKNSLFNITKACEVLEIPRTTVMFWMKNDADFKTEFDAIEEERKDFIEYHAMKKIEEGDTIMTIFAAKCIAGWEEKPRNDKLLVEHRFNQEQLDAMVRGRQVDRGKYQKILKLNDPNIIDAEYEDAN